MSANNLFETRRKGFVIRTVTVTEDYTVRVGSSANNFIVDRVVNVDSSAEAAIAITVPNGLYEGQRVLINFTVEGSAETITVTPATANTTATYSFTDIGDYCSLEWMNSTEGWAPLNSQVA